MTKLSLVQKIHPEKRYSARQGLHMPDLERVLDSGIEAIATYGNIPLNFESRRLFATNPGLGKGDFYEGITLEGMESPTFGWQQLSYGITGGYTQSCMIFEAHIEQGTVLENAEALRRMKSAVEGAGFRMEFEGNNEPGVHFAILGEFKRDQWAKAAEVLRNVNRIGELYCYREPTKD